MSTADSDIRFVRHLNVKLWLNSLHNIDKSCEYRSKCIWIKYRLIEIHSHCSFFCPLECKCLKRINLLVKASSISIENSPKLLIKLPREACQTFKHIIFIMSHQFVIQCLSFSIGILPNVLFSSSHSIEIQFCFCWLGIWGEKSKQFSSIQLNEDWKVSKSEYVITVKDL